MNDLKEQIIKQITGDDGLPQEVVLDNSPINHRKDVVGVFSEIGVKVRFARPYEPRAKRTELVFTDFSLLSGI
jgi:transposase